MAITDKDVDKLKKVFATKVDLERTEQVHRDEMNNKFDRVLSNQEYLIGKVEAIMQEMTISFGQYKRQEEKLADRENRIKVLETSRT